MENAGVYAGGESSQPSGLQTLFRFFFKVVREVKRHILVDWPHHGPQEGGWAGGAMGIAA